MSTAEGENTEDLIGRALRIEGGHLAIGRGGYLLHFGRGATLSGYDCDRMKAACIARLLPVIDSRYAPIRDVARVAVSGPMVAVGEPADPPPWGALSRAPLSVVAAAYRAAGAEVVNLPARADHADEPTGAPSAANEATHQSA